jgi:hypothetical protein
MIRRTTCLFAEKSASALNRRNVLSGGSSF